MLGLLDVHGDQAVLWIKQFQCSLKCVSVIDHFELVLRFFWTVQTSKNPHSRKHPLYLHHTPRKSSQSAETGLISLSISLKIP